MGTVRMKEIMTGKTEDKGIGKMQKRHKGKRISGYLKDYVVFDLETTGIHQELDDIIEISAVKVQDHKVVEQFSTLINPGRHIPATATAVNGITDQMVADAPGIESVIGDFLEFIGDSVLVGHNIHSFDTNFVYDAALQHLERGLSNDYVDTLFMARKCLPSLSHHRLTDIAEHFQIETEGAHRALQDCIMNQLCYEELGKILEKLEEEKRQRLTAGGRSSASMSSEEEELVCPECGAILVRRKGRYGYFYGCQGFPICRYTRNG